MSSGDQQMSTATTGQPHLQQQDLSKLVSSDECDFRQSLPADGLGHKDFYYLRLKRCQRDTVSSERLYWVIYMK